MKRKFEEIRVRVYANTDPSLKHRAEVLAAETRISLSELVIQALRYKVVMQPAVKQAAKRRTKEPWKPSPWSMRITSKLRTAKEKP